MDYITLEVLLRTMEDSQRICVFDLTENNVGSIEDMCTGIATLGSFLYTGKIRDIKYHESKDFDKYKVTKFFSTSHNTITIGVVRIPNLTMDFSHKNGFEVKVN